MRTKRPSRRSSFVAATLLLLTLSSSLAYGLARRHIAWDGLLMGIGTSKIRGPIEMVGGKVLGTTLATVSYKGDTPEVSRPWHVHMGSCVKGGAIFGDASEYTPLRVDAKGTAEGKATLRVALPDSGSFYVNIHESATNMKKVVACGDLLLED